MEICIQENNNITLSDQSRHIVDHIIRYTSRDSDHSSYCRTLAHMGMDIPWDSWSPQLAQAWQVAPVAQPMKTYYRLKEVSMFDNTIASRTISAINENTFTKRTKQCLTGIRNSKCSCAKWNKNLRHVFAMVAAIFSSSRSHAVLLITGLRFLALAIFLAGCGSLF